MMGRKYDRAVETRFYPDVNSFAVEGANRRTSRKKVVAKP